MKSLKVKALSPIQKRKLKKGLKVRVKKPIKGAGFSTIIVDPYKFNVVSKLFDKDKGTELVLTDEELQSNMDVIDGTGLFKVIDKTMKKKGFVPVVTETIKEDIVPITPSGIVEMSDDNIVGEAVMKKSKKCKSKKTIKGKAVMSVGVSDPLGVIQVPRYQGGDSPGFVNPNHLYRTQTPQIFYQQRV
jgi:hypothetical protein